MPDAARSVSRAPQQDSLEAPSPLFHLRWGLERETHRVRSDGTIATSTHPPLLRGPAFSRDFAESQLEIATRPHDSIPGVLLGLEELTAAARRAVAPELLWPSSMPPSRAGGSRVAIADLGPGAAERRATAYRRGLALRYGEARQAICGVHANVSVGASLLATAAAESPLTPAEREGNGPTDGFYLRLARNLYRDLPFLVLLTGASPTGGSQEGPDAYAISWRNGPRGYARDEFLPFLNMESVEAYVAAIRRGLRTESRAFAKLGLVRDGAVIQLNGKMFQTEKEFYAPIRLRQAPVGDESGLDGLSRRGIGYLELRFLDVDPFSRIGVAEETLRLLHLFVLDDLTRPSRVHLSLRASVQAASKVASWNPAALKNAPGVTHRSFLLAAAHRRAALSTWATHLDAASGRDSYRRCLGLFQRRVAEPHLLPSAVLAHALAESGLDWTSFGLQHAQQQGET